MAGAWCSQSCCRCRTTRLPAILPVCRTTCLPSCLLNNLPAHLPAEQPGCMQDNLDHHCAEGMDGECMIQTN
jgi:hypothetical protein